MDEVDMYSSSVANVEAYIKIYISTSINAWA